MDLRTERTRQSIKNAFFELRKQKPLEKISVKELAELAYINKATFYTHYHDIFDLADQLENEFFELALADSQYMDCLVENPSLAVQELMKVLSHKKNTSDILFSGSRQGYYAQKLHTSLRNLSIAGTLKKFMIYNGISSLRFSSMDAIMPFRPTPLPTIPKK